MTILAKYCDNIVNHLVTRQKCGLATTLSQYYHKDFNNIVTILPIVTILQFHENVLILWQYCSNIIVELSYCDNIVTISWESVILWQYCHNICLIIIILIQYLYNVYIQILILYKTCCNLFCQFISMQPFIIRVQKWINWYNDWWFCKLFSSLFYELIPSPKLFNKVVVWIKIVNNSLTTKLLT